MFASTKVDKICEAMRTDVHFEVVELVSVGELF